MIFRPSSAYPPLLAIDTAQHVLVTEGFCVLPSFCPHNSPRSISFQTQTCFSPHLGSPLLTHTST